MRRLVSILVLLVFAGIAALFFVERAPPESPARERPVQDAMQPARAAESSLDPGLTTAAAPSAREDLAPPTPVAAPAAPEALDPRRARLSVRVIGRSSRRPLAQVQVYLELEAANDESRSGDLEHFRTTDAGGLATFELPADRELRLWANAAPGVAGNANVRVHGLRASEQRALVVELPDLVDAPLFGRVLGEEGDVPIAGARVQFVEAEASASGARGPAPHEVRTNDEGVFELRFPSWEQPHLRVEAEGYGPRIASTRGAHAELEHALSIRLSRSATLHAHVLGASGAAIAGARIELSANGAALLFDEAHEHGLTFRDFGGLPDEHWRGETAANGCATIAELPPRVELALVVTGEAGRVLRREPIGLRFQAGETRELELRVGAGTCIRGRVLDQQKRPVAGAELWLLKAGEPTQRRIYAFQGKLAAAKSNSDADGAYVFPDVPAGSWLIGPAEYFPTEKLAGPDSIAGVAALVQLSDEADLTLDLRVSRGLLIRGIVIAPDGAPVSGAQVSAHCESSGNLAYAQTGLDGGFVIGPLEFESYAIAASDRGHFAPTDEVQAQPGEQPLVLRLKPSGKLRGKVVDETSGVACAANVIVHTGATDGTGVGGVALVKDDGEFELAGIALGLCTVTASTTDGRFAQVQTEVFADRVSVAPLLSLAHGGTLRLRYTGAGNLSFFSVGWNGTIVLFGEELDAGKTKEMPAPAGKLALRVCKYSSSWVRDIQIELARGETREVTVTDEK